MRNSLGARGQVGSVTGSGKVISVAAARGGGRSVCGIPWRVALALQTDGWYLRSDIIWAKPNPMPESVTDRPTRSHEYLFLLAKSERYYYDAEAIKEPISPKTLTVRTTPRKTQWGGIGWREIEPVDGTPSRPLPSFEQK